MVDERLFRREASRLVGALTRLFGMANLALAEDVVQDAVCAALERWAVEGVPNNPGAWLMTAAKHRAVDALRRERTARTQSADVGRHLEADLEPSLDDCFAPAAIRDEQLRMMFSCCDPRLTEDAQLALILNVLCGFNVPELAQLFLASPAAMKKRITRAKGVLVAERELFVMATGKDVGDRLPAVLRALYLLFSEGFHGACAEAAVREDVCRDAMRLAGLLLDHASSAVPESFALAALMCFHAARLPARLGEEGRLQPLRDQRRALWDRALIAEGQRLMAFAATGKEVSAYHVEATIAAAHCAAASVESTDWRAIVALYELLLRLQPSPVVELQRAIAIGELAGPERGLEELARIEDAQRLAQYPFYAAARGELAFRCNRLAEAQEGFREAAHLARNDVERRYFRERLEKLRS